VAQAPGGSAGAGGSPPAPSPVLFTPKPTPHPPRTPVNTVVNTVTSVTQQVPGPAGPVATGAVETAGGVANSLVSQGLP
jgi:hypothetical protein